MPAAATQIEEIKHYSLKGVEIFSVGKWNDTTITLEDLHDMVRSFHDLKVGWRPFLKLGHDNKQLVAKSSGLPAIGWVENVYVQADKLLADFTDIPERVFRLIKSKAYRKVSCEVYFDMDVAGNHYKAILGAVALLGAEKPGVMNLTDILGQFEKWEKGEVFAILEKQDTFKQYSINFELSEEDDSMSVEQLEKDLENQTKLADEHKAKFEAETAKVKELEEKSKGQGEELENLRKFKADAEAKAIQAELDAKKAKKEAFMTKLEAAKLITPVTKGLIDQLLDDKKEFSLEEGKTCSREEVVEQILKLTVDASKVNFEENSLADGDPEMFSKDKQDEMDKKIQKYMADKQCSYAVAYKECMKSAKAQ